MISLSLFFLQTIYLSMCYASCRYTDVSVMFWCLILTSCSESCQQTEIFFWPVFVIATLAAMIASQAMISATFSCVKQAMALGCFPRLKIIHTSRRQMGQIYIPVINWFLMIMCITVVSIFRSTTDISNAYG